MRHVLLSALFSCVLILPALAQTAPSQPEGPQARPEGKEGRRYRKPDALKQSLAKLNLSEQQKTQVQAVFSRNRETFEQMGDLKRQMREARESKDEAALKQIQQEMQDLKPQLKAAMEKNRADILNILTPAQREQLEAMKSQRPSRES